ncbi:NF-kappa-B essential modulator isoform X2 [Drosophila bipectinata]|uniref:NF-kappa-B essential modulator isoform X2 n=1 Tax=Drosophila bipectinata TaxID=42026 RepID=UPI001C894F1C|nr:NF-kappa-B essential modulator isoform X2 [Drosophila bipectinata]
MSEEESFVILGSSPLPSLLFDGMEHGEEVIESAAMLQSSSDHPISSSTSEPQRSLETGGAPQSLAASFIMGEVGSDVLKNSVYSQFPSLCSLQASAEDVVKLQNLLSEYHALKSTLDKLSCTMLNYHKLTQQRRQEAAKREQHYRDQLLECQKKVEKLSQENQQLREELETKMEQIELVQSLNQKEQDELRQSASEKMSLINNMRVEIDKLQQLKMHSFEFVPDDGATAAKESEGTALNYVQREEHDRQVRELKQQLSQLLAENLEIKDMKKTYVEKIDCLKVNLTSAQELMDKMQRDISELKAKDAQKQEVIEHLQTQNDIYRKDFEMERADREKNAGEKDQYLLDLKALQRRNQELIEALAESHKSSSIKSSPASSLSSSRHSLREDQRPVLDPTAAAASTAESILRCPICSKTFKNLSVLQSHVNDCLDKN